MSGSRAAGARPLAPEELEGVPTIELLNELKRRHQLLGKPPARVALLGPPCAGKRTQAEALRRAFGICRISADDLSGGSDGRGSADERAASALTTLLDRPQCRRGFVLEGFPRTAAQAMRMEEVLEERGTPLQAAVFLDAPEEALVERCQGRLFHPTSGRLYHDRFKPPAEEGVDDFTGEALTRPPHDSTAFRRDLEGYRERAGLLREFFGRRNVVRDVDAKGGAEEVSGSCVIAVQSP